MFTGESFNIYFNLFTKEFIMWGEFLALAVINVVVPVATAVVQAAGPIITTIIEIIIK